MSKYADDVLIIGAGLQGCAIGMFLARSGWKVTIVDKGVPGRHASGVNAGGLRLLMRDVREYPLSMRAMEMWRNLERFVDPSAVHSCEVRLGSSQIAIALDEAEMAWVRARHQEMLRRGYTCEEFIDPHELRRMLPGLADSVLGGLISRGDGHANPANAALAFRQAAEAAGAVIHEQCALNGLNRNANGRWLADTDVGVIEPKSRRSWVMNCRSRCWR
jgi:sarcosine oxidase subunit beta